MKYPKREMLADEYKYHTESSKRLTDRHRSVLFLLSKGFRNSEIALQLGLTDRTVKTSISELFFIFDVSNRTELVGLVVQQLSSNAATSR